MGNFVRKFYRNLSTTYPLQLFSLVLCLLGGWVLWRAVEDEGGLRILVGGNSTYLTVETTCRFCDFQKLGFPSPSD